MKNIRVWIYIRVSTKEQVKNGFGKDLQLTKIKKYIEYNFDKWYIFDEDLIYKDLWISGAKDETDRPWLNQLKQDIKNKKIDVVIVYKLDRLARKTKLILELIDYFKFYNVDFVSTNETIATDSPTGEFFLTILSAIGQMERDLITEKTIEWWIEWAKKWFFSTWWEPSFGFKKDTKTKNVIIVAEEAEIVKEIFNLYVKESKSLNEISSILTSRKVQTSFDRKGKTRKNKSNYWKWNSTCISKILSNEAYIWLYWLNKSKNEYYVTTDETWREIKKKKRVQREKEEWIALEIENTIEVEIFEKAQAKLKTNKFRNNNNNKAIIDYLFSNLIRCWICGSNFRWEKWRANKEWIFNHAYRCSKSSYSKFKDKKCSNSQVRESELIDKIFIEINKFFKNPNLVVKQYLLKEKNNNKEDKYKKELEENNINIKKNLSNVEELFERLIQEENLEFKAIIQNKIDRNRSEIKHLENRNIEVREIVSNHKKVVEESKSFEKYLEEYKWQNIYSMTHKQQRAILEKVIKSIVILEDTIDVLFVFRDSEDEDVNKKHLSYKWKVFSCFQNGGTSGARTQDLPLKRGLLYQLS